MKIRYHPNHASGFSFKNVRKKRIAKSEVIHEMIIPKMSNTDWSGVGIGCRRRS